jgi:hypothetical protein
MFRQGLHVDPLILHQVSAEIDDQFGPGSSSGQYVKWEAVLELGVLLGGDIAVPVLYRPTIPSRWIPVRISVKDLKLHT